MSTDLAMLLSMKREADSKKEDIASKRSMAITNALNARANASAINTTNNLAASAVTANNSANGGFHLFGTQSYSGSGGLAHPGLYLGGIHGQLNSSAGLVLHNSANLSSSSGVLLLGPEGQFRENHVVTIKCNILRVLGIYFC